MTGRSRREEGGKKRRSKGWPPAPDTGSDGQRDSKEDGIWVSLSAWAVLSMLQLSVELHADLMGYSLHAVIFQGISSSSS